MAETPQKGKVIPIYQPFKQASRLRTRRWLNLAIIVVIVIAAVLGSIFATNYTAKKHQASVSRDIRLVFANSADGQASVVSNTGAVINHQTIPKSSLAKLEGLSPSGSALLSLNAPSPLETYVLLSDNQQKLGNAAIKALKSADYVNDSHHILLLDDHTAAYVSCAAGKSCKLVKSDLDSGKTQTIADTGVTKKGLTDYVYLVGKSDDGSSLYLRVSGKNKLGKDSYALYQVALDGGKVLGKTALPQYTGYNLSLSPDQKRLVYAAIVVGDTKHPGLQTVFHVVNISDGRDTTVKWPQLGLGTQSGALSWSPDGSKILFSTGTITSAPGAKTSTHGYLAYLDVNKNQVVELQAPAAASSFINSLGWLDNDHVVYDVLSLNISKNKPSTKDQIYKQGIKDKDVTRFSGPQSSMLGVAYR